MYNSSFHDAPILFVVDIIIIIIIDLPSCEEYSQVI
jgi:hypothetical protein